MTKFQSQLATKHTIITISNELKKHYYYFLTNKQEAIIGGNSKTDSHIRNDKMMKHEIHPYQKH